MDQLVLDAMADFLNAGGTNYTVFVRAFPTPAGSDLSSAALIRRAVGQQVSVEKITVASVHELLADVTSSLSYAGDDGAGPDRSDLQSLKFRKLLTNVIAEVCSLADRSSKIEQFTFGAGHPAYPVFWDFAYLFTGPVQSVVLVGSSSD